MSETMEARLIREFRSRLDQGQLGDDCQVTTRIVGGMPSQRLDEEVRLAGGRKAHVRRVDQINNISGEELDADLDIEEAHGLLREIETILDSMMKPSEARFGPDALVGILTIQIGEEQVTRYFDPQEPEAGRLKELRLYQSEASPEGPGEAGDLSAGPAIRELVEAATIAGAPVRKVAGRVRATAQRLVGGREEPNHG